MEPGSLEGTDTVFLGWTSIGELHAGISRFSSFGRVSDMRSQNM